MTVVKIKMALEAMLGMPDLSASHRERRGEAAFGGNVDPLLLDDMDVQLPPFVSNLYHRIIISFPEG